MEQIKHWRRLGNAAVDTSKVSAVRRILAEGDCFRVYLLIDGMELELPFVAETEVEAFLQVFGIAWEEFQQRSAESAPPRSRFDRYTAPPTSN